ncbi:MAG: methyltransferase domain-containing protein [Acidobacteriota bacterium]|nr:methyltransferase domain-containing protein [Acidobacteriota bacterium]
MPDRLDFSCRAQLAEEIDGPCSFEDLRDCLRDLAVVNRIVLTHRPIFAWLQRVATSPAVRQLNRPLRIVDVGCGYGDMLRRLERWAAARQLSVDLIGIDINANGLRSAREATPPASRIRWLPGDAITHPETAHSDIILASGMTHHLTEPELIALLQWMERAADIGWMICDLHRKPVPYHCFDISFRGPWWHRFIRPDGLRSIRRSFLEEDWERICAAANLAPGAAQIRAYRPARLCVERVKQP